MIPEFSGKEIQGKSREFPKDQMGIFSDTGMKIMSLQYHIKLP